MTDNKSLLHVPVYPFLIALAPVISLYVVNRLELTAFDLVRPAAVSLFLALAAVVVSRAVSDSIRSAAILGFFLLFSMVAYGHVFRSMSMVFEIENLNSYLLPIWLLLTVGVWALLAFALRKKRSSLLNVTKIFNIIGITFITAASVPLMLGSSPSEAKPQRPEVTNESTNPLITEWLSSLGEINQNPNELPDIYYIILDAYARGDVLKSRFEFDNSVFLDWLESKGFFVAHLSHANYPWTHLSLSATFNLEYLQTLIPENSIPPGPDDGRKRFQFFMGQLSRYFITDSRLHHFLSSLGYRIISNKSGYAVTRIEPAYLSDAMLGPMNEFEETLIRNSIIEPLILKFRSDNPQKHLPMTKYDQVVNTLDEFGYVANEKGPKFVFYHLGSPHSPYCFDENGEMVAPHPVYDASPWMSDKRKMPGYFAWGKKAYPKNVAGLNIHVINSIQKILDESEGDAIIILQSDHGPGFGIKPYEIEKTDVLERFGILNAIYLPDKFPRVDLDKRISSVNTFRLILRNAFNVNLPILENRAYYSNGDLDFQDVTDRL